MSRSAALGDRFPSLVAETLLKAVLPPDRRDEVVGDLIEETETVVLPRDGRRRALRWFWWQIVASAPRMLALRCTREVRMNRHRLLVAAVILVLGGLTAWDSGVAAAAPYVIGLVLLAIAVPVVACLLSGHRKVYLGAILVSATLLLAARMISGIELRWYAMAWLFLMALLIGWWFEQRTKRSDGGGSSGPHPAT
jgi:hypothetical protein